MSVLTQSLVSTQHAKQTIGELSSNKDVQTRIQAKTLWTAVVLPAFEGLRDYSRQRKHSLPGQPDW